MVKHFGLVFAPDDGGVPVKTVFNILCIPAKILYGRRHDIGTGLCFGIQHFDSALVTAAQYQLRLIRVKSQEGTLATCRGRPACTADAAAAQLTAGNIY